MLARIAVDTPSTQLDLLDLLDSLAVLVRTLKTSEFRSLDALLTALAYDDAAAGSMLKRVLYWHGRLGREFYLSKADWWQQCRVKRSVVDRVKKDVFPQCGVLMTVKHTGKANTTHFTLHLWKFLRRLADVVGLPAMYLAQRCVGIQRNVTSESSATLTRFTTRTTTQEQEPVVNDTPVLLPKIVKFKSDLPESKPSQLRVIELLKKAGVAGQRAVTYALLPEAAVRVCIADVQSAVDAKRVRPEKRVAYLVGALKNQAKALTPSPSPVDEREFVTDIPAQEPPISPENSGVGESDWRDTLRKLKPVANAAPEPANERLAVMVSDGYTAQRAWNAAFQQLELQLDRASFDTWLRSARLLDYGADGFVVGVHNSYARDMLQHRFYRNVARVLRDVVGREASVRFEVIEP